MRHEHSDAAATWVVPWNAEQLSRRSVRRSFEADSAAVSLRGRGGVAAVGYRRAVIALSLVGLCSLATLSLYQMGMLRYLPNLPVRRFH